MALALSEMSKELRNSMGSIRQASDKVQESSVNLTKTSQESRENSEELKRQMDTIDVYKRQTLEIGTYGKFGLVGKILNIIQKIIQNSSANLGFKQHQILKR